MTVCGAMRKDIENLVSMYPAAIAEKGVTPAGVLWPNGPDLATRFDILLSPIDFKLYGRTRPLKLLDLGCGPGFLLDYLSKNRLVNKVAYTGVDVTKETMGHAISRWPNYRFELRDVRERPFQDDSFDFCIACGVFTVRFGNSYEQMKTLVCETLLALWRSVTIGLSFNVMSKHVDWEREDLFHWPLDDIMAFCKGKLSRHVSLRLDYGLWETSVLVLKSPVPRRAQVPSQWLEGASESTEHR